MTKLLDLPVPLEQRRQYGIFTDCCALPTLNRHTYIVANLAAGADQAATVIFSPTRDIVVTSVSITPDGTAAGIDDSNTSVWSVSDGTTNIAAKTYNASTVHPADNVKDTLTSTGTSAVIASGGRLEFTLTNGATADTVPTVLDIEYYDLQAFPEAGWRVLSSDDGVPSISDARRGILSLPASDGSVADNDEIYLHSAVELFLFASDCPIVAECRIQYSEANADDANVIFGLLSGVAANALQDDGAGPPASYSGAVLFKVDGGTVWQTESSLATTQTTTASTTTAGGSSYQTLRVEFRPVTSTYGEVFFFVDGVQLQDSNLRLIFHTLTYTSATEMSVVVGIKNGGANLETLLVDYIGAWELRQ